MSLLTRLVARAWKGNAEVDLMASGLNNLIVDMGGPKYLEYARRGRIFRANTGAGTAVAPVVAVPTTAAAHYLYNGSQIKSNRCLILLKAAMWLVSGTTAIGGSIWAATEGLEQTTAGGPTPLASSVQATNAYGVAGNSRAVYTTAATLKATACWDPLDGQAEISEVAIGRAWVAKDLDGLFIATPQRGIALTKMDAAAGTSPLYGASFTWLEVDVDFE